MLSLTMSGAHARYPDAQSLEKCGSGPRLSTLIASGELPSYSYCRTADGYVRLIAIEDGGRLCDYVVSRETRRPEGAHRIGSCVNTEL